MSAPRGVDTSTSDAERASLFDREECLRPAEAFAVVGDETRLAVLEALWAAPERPVTFPDLRSRVEWPTARSSTTASGG